MSSIWVLTVSAIACVPPAVAYADVFSIGHLKFDFDAPSPPLNAAQQSLFQRYKKAVNENSETELMALQDSSLKSCPDVLRQAIVGDLGKTIPDTAKVRFFPAARDIANEMGFGDLAYLSAQPTAVLGIEGSSKSKEGVQVVTILRPVRQNGNQLSLVPYCLTAKGKAALQQKH